MNPLPLFFREEKKAALECLLFVAGGPVTVETLAASLGLSNENVIELALELKKLYNEEGRGLQIREVAGGYQMCTRPQYAHYIETFLRPELPSLSMAALETLAVIAYRQPVTRAEIEHIRGVKVDGILTSLLNRGLIKEAGRKDAPGRPILYVTTPRFLELLGLKDLSELPPLEEAADVRE